MVLISVLYGWWIRNSVVNIATNLCLKTEAVRAANTRYVHVHYK